MSLHKLFGTIVPAPCQGLAVGKLCVFDLGELIMQKIRLPGAIGAPILALITLIAIVGCGGGGDTPTSVPTVAVSPTAPSVPLPATQAVLPTATTGPVAPTAPVPTTVPATVAPTQPQPPAPTSAPVPTAEPTLVPSATPTPNPSPTPIPALPTSYEEFGFKLRLDRGADVRSAGSPTAQQGAVTFAYGAVNTVLTWTPQEGSALLALVDGTYSFVQDAQPGRTFQTLVDGELTADDQPGVFLGFKAVDAEGNASGGLIGAWACPASETSFTLTLTGDDTALVQVRFDELIENFSCSTS